jgi:hypothetical protein
MIPLSSSVNQARIGFARENHAGLRMAILFEISNSQRSYIVPDLILQTAATRIKLYQIYKRQGKPYHQIRPGFSKE